MLHVSLPYVQTTISSKGQLVLPAALRRKLRLQAGDKLTARVQGDSIVLFPLRRRIERSRIVKDKLTGLPVVLPPKGAAPVTSEQIRAALADFP